MLPPVDIQVARAVQTFVILETSDGGPLRLTNVGYCRDEFKLESGSWVFTSRKVFLDRFVTAGAGE